MDNRWHISKTVNVTVLLSVAIQTAAIIWGAAKLDSRVGNIEDWIKTNASTQVTLVEHSIRINALERKVGAE
jgi:hypothetical protein